jgi:hypothetical protein
MKTIYTVIPYFSCSDDGIVEYDVKSFYTLEDAQLYSHSLNYAFDIVENPIN